MPCKGRLKLVKIGVNFRDKKLNPTLKDWVKDGHKLVWKKRYVKENTLVYSKARKLFKPGARKPHTRQIKRRYYDVYVATRSCK